MKKILAMLLCCVMVVAMFAGMTVSAAETTDGYTVYLGVQTNTTLWIFRNAYDDATYGYGMTDADTGVVPFDGLWAVGQPALYAGTFTDAALDGNGSYTVSLDAPDFQQEEAFSLIYLSSNIPLDAGITISNIAVKANGKTAYTFEEAYLDPDSTTYVKVLMQNAWNNDVKDLFYIPEPYNLTNLTVTFDVTGFDYDKAVEEAPADDATTETPADDTAEAEGGCTGSVAFPALAAVIAVAALAIFKKRA